MTRFAPALLLLVAVLVHAQDREDARSGREVYRSEACWQCHVHASDKAFPAIRGTRRTGPILGRTRVARSRAWHRAHFFAPRAVAAESQMPAYPKHFRPHPRAADVDAFLTRHDTRDGGVDQDGVVTRPEYERTGGTDWAGALERLDADRNAVVSRADAAPVASAALEALVDYLAALDPGAPGAVAVPERPAGDREGAVERGAELYARHCAGCHGARGDGDGPAAAFFGAAAPRNFLRGEFKYRSSRGGDPPFDADLFRTIRRGAGPSMPAWPDFSDAQVWDLVEYVKSHHPYYVPHEMFVEARRGGRVVHAYTKTTEEADAAGRALGDGRLVKRAGRWFWVRAGRETPVGERLEAGDFVFRRGKAVFDWIEDFAPRAVAIPDPPIPYTAASAAIGAKVYEELGCAACHGAEGKGDGPGTRTFRGTLGEVLVPADYSRGARWLKGGADPASLVRTFFTGLQGTPMPAFESDFKGTKTAPPDRAPWHLAHFVMRQAGIEFEK